MLLKLDKIAKDFGGIRALNGVSVEVESGKIYGLIGPNGSGKTTLLNIISGLIQSSGGRVVLAGQDITGWKPHRVATAGIGRTFQLLRLFPEMSVIDNVLVGRYGLERTGIAGSILRLPSQMREARAARVQANSLIETLGLAQYSRRLAGELSYGDQRRVEIARALALEPKLLLLDEPVCGMNPTEAKRLGTLLMNLREAGNTLVVVEHNLRLIMDCCDEIVVLNFGSKIAQGTPEAVRRSPEVIEAYLGHRRA